MYLVEVLEQTESATLRANVARELQEMYSIGAMRRRSRVYARLEALAQRNIEGVSRLAAQIIGRSAPVAQVASSSGN